jgi:DNA-binding CsgD family transcriptional regulator
VEKFFKDIIKSNADDEVTVFTELCLSTAYVSGVALNMVPDWMKNGDFSFLHPKAKIDAAYKRAKYFQNLGKFESMLSVAETALALCGSSSQGIAFHDIYFRVLCAWACFALKREDKAKRWLRDAIEIALPNGFLTPFAESVQVFGGLLERCLEQDYPESCDAIVKQWRSTFTNWLVFHNRFSKDNITLILTLREYQIAMLAARRVPYKKIAEQQCISISRVKSIISVIYGKLFISNRDRLAEYIL